MQEVTILRKDYLEYRDPSKNSFKFYQLVEVQTKDGSIKTVVGWGRIGNNPQTTTYNGRNAYDEKLQQKLNKGYFSSTGGNVNIGYIISSEQFKLFVENKPDYDVEKFKRVRTKIEKLIEEMKAWNDSKEEESTLQRILDINQVEKIYDTFIKEIKLPKEDLEFMNLMANKYRIEV